MSNSPTPSSTDMPTFVNTEFQNYGWVKMFVKWYRPRQYFNAYAVSYNENPGLLHKIRHQCYLQYTICCNSQ
jgi:hypothetical protein